MCTCRLLLAFLAICLLMSGPLMAERALEKRVVGGFLIPEQQGAYAVYIKRKDSDGAIHVCGGSILSSEHIVTAAHCVIDSNLSVTPAADISVGYGSVELYRQTTVTVIKATVHPDYMVNGQKNRTNDIAIMQIPKLVFSGTVQRIALYSLPIGAKEPVMAIGWGQTETGFQSTALRGSTLVTGTVSDCKLLFSSFDADGPLICTPGKYTPGVSSCNGDSGTGVTINNEGTPMLAAFDSHVRWNGKRTCSAETSVHYYLHTIYHLKFIMDATGLSKKHLSTY